MHQHHIGRSTIQSPEADRARAFAHHLQFAQPRTAMTDTVKSADALLPCPFCGGEAKHSPKGWGYAETVSCACGVDFDGSPAEWNTRALTAQAAEPGDGAPEHLWAWYDTADEGWDNAYASTAKADRWAVQYIRADLATPAPVEAEPVAGVRCNQCGWEGGEEDLIGTLCVVDGDPCRGCPDCKTDHGLIDIAHPTPAQPATEADHSGGVNKMVSGPPGLVASRVANTDGGRCAPEAPDHIADTGNMVTPASGDAPAGATVRFGVPSGTTREEMRNWLLSTDTGMSLHRHGDCLLVWANEGDLFRIPTPVSTGTARPDLAPTGNMAMVEAAREAVAAWREDEMQNVDMAMVKLSIALPAPVSGEVQE